MSCGFKLPFPAYAIPGLPFGLPTVAISVEIPGPPGFTLKVPRPTFGLAIPGLPFGLPTVAVSVEIPGPPGFTLKVPRPTFGLAIPGLSLGLPSLWVAVEIACPFDAANDNAEAEAG